MILGHIASDDLSPTTAPADSILVSEFVVAKQCLISKLSAFLDGDGTANGDQAYRAVIYDSNGDLLAESPEVVVGDLSEPAWVDFVFHRPVSINADSYIFGLHTGPVADASQFYGSGDGTNAALISEPYENGAPSVSYTHLTLPTKRIV